MLTRRTFFRTAGFGAAVAAASATFPAELLSWAEPPRAPQPGGPILLNSNENAYGPLPSVLALNNPFLELNRYPDRRHELLMDRLAAKHRVSAEQIVVTCGSTEVLKAAASAYTGPGRKLIMAAPTFEAIDNYARAVKADVVKIPLAADFTHDLGAMLKAAAQGAGLVYICNPNNPTGNVTPRKELEDFISKLPKSVYVLMDEAYHDFVPATADYVSFLDRPLADDRVIVARTFSKIYGMAGIRLGYSVSTAATAKALLAQRLEDSANVFAIRCAETSLADEAGHSMAAQRNAVDRDEFMRQVSARKLQAIPSATNFVMMDSKRPVRTVIDFFRQNNIRIGRPFPPMETYVRISLGKPEEMKAFWRVWDMMS